MPTQQGWAMLLKIGNAGTPTEIFTTIGGLRAKRVKLQQALLPANTLESGPWRTLPGGGALSALTIDAEGYFADSTAEESLRGVAFAGSIRNFKCVFGNGDSISGPFLVAAYERSGQTDTQEDYAITLESAGQITFTGAYDDL